MLIALLLPLALAVLLFGFILVRSAIQSRAVPNLEAILRRASLSTSSMRLASAHSLRPRHG